MFAFKFESVIHLGLMLVFGCEVEVKGPLVPYRYSVVPAPLPHNSPFLLDPSLFGSSVKGQGPLKRGCVSGLPVLPLVSLKILEEQHALFKSGRVSRPAFSFAG